MPLFNYLKTYRDDLAPLLRTGEQALDMAPFQPPLAGDEGDFERPEQLQGHLERWVQRRKPDVPGPPSDRLLSFDPLDGVEVNQRRVDRRIGGESAAGAASSIAARMLVARMTSQGVFYVVTDRRLLLVATPDLQTTTLVFEISRDLVVSARREPKPLTLQLSRVVLTFADDSRLALLAGWFLAAGRAKTLVAALATTTPGR